MAKVFISYASEDREIALRIADNLEMAGHDIWIDRNRIGAGAKWAEDIVNGIEACEYFILLISHNSLSSDNVRKEVSLAAEDKKIVLPVYIENISKLSSDFRYHLSGLQFISLINAYDTGISNLLNVLNRSPISQSEVLNFPLLHYHGMIRCASLDTVKPEDRAEPETKINSLTTQLLDGDTGNRDNIYYQRAKLYFIKRQKDKAIADYHAAIVLRPYNSEYYFGLADIYDSQSNYDQAIRWYSQAVSANQNDACSFNNRGIMYSKLEKYHEAINDFTSAIKLSGKVYYYNRGNAYSALGHYILAIEDFTTYIRFDPDFDFAYNNRANCFFALGDFEKALDDYTKAINLSASGEKIMGKVFANRAKLHSTMGNIRQRAEDLAQARLYNYHE